MGYPWYSAGTIAVGANQKTAVRRDRNCGTKQYRFRLDISDPTQRTGKKSFTSACIQELWDKVVKYVQLRQLDIDTIDDIHEMFSVLNNL